MKASTLYRVVAYLFGLSILAFGITLLIRANLGIGAWDAFIVALSKLFGLTIGSWIVIVGIFLLIINALMLRERPDLPALFTVFLLGNFVDVWFKTTTIVPSSLLMQYVFFSLGLLIIAFGVAVYTQAHFAITPIDRVMFVIQAKTGYSLRVSRFISEGTALILAYLCHGPIGIGTIIVTILLGPLIQLFISTIHLLSRQENLENQKLKGAP